MDPVDHPWQIDMTAAADFEIVEHKLLVFVVWPQSQFS